MYPSFRAAFISFYLMMGGIKMNTYLSNNRKFKRMLVNILSILVITAVAFPATGGAYAQEPIPSVRAHPIWDSVDGWYWPQETTLHLTIEDPATPTSPDLQMDMPGTVDPNLGSVWFDFAGTYDLKPGDQVTISDGTTTKYLEVSTHEITAVDLEADTIAGIGEPGTQVRLPVPGEFFVTADEYGDWLADFKQMGVDLLPGTMFIAEVFDEDGDNSSFELYVPNPRFEVRGEADSVAGWEWQPNAEVSISIDGAYITTAPVDESGYFNMVISDLLNIVPGMNVEVTDGINTKAHFVSRLRITDVDVKKDMAHGIATSGSRIQAGICGPDDCVNRWEMVDQAGNWSVNFSVPGDEPGEEQTFDLVPGSWVESWEWDEDGDNTISGYYIPNPRMVIFPEWEFFDGHDWPDGASVKITVKGKPECKVTKESWGNFFNGNFGEGCDVVIGDEVTFAYRNTTLKYVVRHLAITGVDPGENTITGIADPGTTVFVWPHDGGFEPLQVIADDSGVWQVDLDDAGYDIQPGASGRSEIRDETGNATAVDWHVPNPVFEVRDEANSAAGWEWQPGTEVNISVDGMSVATAQVDEWGYFGTTLDLVGVVPGMQVEVTDGVSSKEHMVSPLSINHVDVDTELVTGIGTPHARIQAQVCGPDGCIDRWETVSDTGDWWADFSVPGNEPGEEQTYDFVPGTWLDSREWDEDGDNTVAGYYIPNPRLTIFPLWQWYDGLDWPDGAVNITVAGKPDCDVTRTSSNYFFNGGFSSACYVEVGDTITFENGTITRSHVVRNLVIADIDLRKDTISGISDPGATVYIWPHDGWFEPLQVIANNAGAWQADLGDVGYDILEDAAGRAEVRDEFGNATAVDWNLNSRIVVQITDDWFRAEGFAPNTSLKFQIYDSPGGRRLLKSTTGRTDSGGTITHWVGDRMDVIPGNYVVVSDGKTTRDIVVEDLAFDIFDTTVGLLQGTAPEPFGRMVSVGIGCWQRDDLTSDTMTDETGTWEVDFHTPVPNDFGCVFAWIYDVDGDVSESRPAQIVWWEE
jgi:hypothetical protein